MAKIVGKTFLHSFVLIFAFCTMVDSNTVPQDSQNHRELSNNPSWSAWFHHRQQSSLNHSSQHERHNRDGNNNIHGRHETQHSRPPAGARVFHDAMLRNSRSRGRDANAKETRRNFNDGRSIVRVTENESLVHSGNARGSSGIQGSSDVGVELFESRRSTTTTTTTRTNSIGEGNSGNESEKLTAVAVAEYSGTRAVAYAGYHHHNLDYNPTRTRESLTPGYALVVTAVTPTYTKHHAG